MRLSLAALTLAAGQQTGAPAGQFETWVMAFEWQPTWSLADCGKSEEVINHLSGQAYANNHLSMHGLWPNYDPAKHSGSKWPQFCKGAQGDFTTCEHSVSDPVCQPSAAEVAAFNTTTVWQQFAMEWAYSDLAPHEWSKHGGCTGWTQDKFFKTSEQTYTTVRAMAGPAFIEAHAGSSVSPSDLKAAFEKTPGLGCDSCSLGDVWVALALDPTTLLPTTAIDYADPPTTCDSCAAVKIPSWQGCSAPGPSPGPAPGPSPAGQCVKNVKGPACTYDPKVSNTPADPCKNLTDCVRCAHSGACTDVPLAEELFLA